MAATMRVLDIATVTSKGQITLPKRIREQLEIDSGDQLYFIEDRENNRIYISNSVEINRDAFFSAPTSVAKTKL